MNFPFKINYVNGIADTVEYDLPDNFKDNPHEGNHYQEKKKALELLCDIVNSTDIKHYSYMNGGSNQSNAKSRLERYFYRGNLERYSYNLNPLPFGWLEEKKLVDIIDRFQNEIFYFNIKYNVNSRSLVFETDTFLSNSICTLRPRPIKLNDDKNHSILEYYDREGEAPLSVQLTYSPFQYQVHRHFEDLCETLRVEIVSLISKSIESDFFLSLYVQSKEFLLYHFELLMRKYHPQSLICNDYLGQKYDFSELLMEIPFNLAEPLHIQNKFIDDPITFDDYLSTYAKNYPFEVLKCFMEELKKDKSISEEILKNSATTIISNNRYISSLYAGGLHDEYLTFIEYSFKLNLRHPIITISIVQYTNAITHKIRKLNDSTQNMKIPMAEYYNLHGRRLYSSPKLDVLAVIYNDISNPFLMPILSAQEISVRSYLKAADRKYHVNLYEAFRNAYEKSDFSKAPFIKTDSLTLVLSELLKAARANKGKRIRRCEECQKFFVATHGKEKYCDAPNRKKNSPPEPGTCSWKAKQRLEGVRKEAVGKIDDLNRNELYSLRDLFDKLQGMSIINSDDISTAYNKFMYILKGFILRDFIFEKEQKYIRNNLRKSNSEEQREDLIGYAKAIFPQKEAFKKETIENLPTTHRHICTFYTIPSGSFIDKTHTVSFDWSDYLPKIIDGPNEPYADYNAFRDRLRQAATERPSLFKDLPEAVSESLIYLNSMDSRWQDVVDTIHPKRMKPRTRTRK
ncbi:MAG: DUF6076 domain-containing protein [Bacillota bacterium]|nr:DUF6076 domain-containing protein [Bacillota bacterium]